MEIYLSLRQVPGTFGVLFHGTGRSTVRCEDFDAFLLRRLEVGFHGHHVTLAAGTALTQVQSSFHRLRTTPNQTMLQREEHSSDGQVEVICRHDCYLFLI